MIKYLFIFIDPLKKIDNLKAFRAVIALLMITCFVTGYFVVDAFEGLWAKYNKEQIRIENAQEKVAE